jgi:ABC-type transport system involved in cytochrome c biogenesis permease subunit
MILRRAIAVFALAAGLCSAPARGDVDSLGVWQHIPVLENGRVMPLDSYARHMLLGFSGKSTFDRKPAALWLARVLFTPEQTRDDKIFLVDNPEVIEAIGLSAEGRSRYSFAELQPALAELTRLARAAFHLEEDARSPVENAIMRLYNNVNLYMRLSQGFDFLVPREDFAITSPELRRALQLPAERGVSLYDLRPKKPLIDALLNEYRAAGKVDSLEGRELFNAATILRMRTMNRRDMPPAIMPVFVGGKQEWVGPWDVFTARTRGEDAKKELDALRDMAEAFVDGAQIDFDLAARTYVNSVNKRVADPKVLRNIKREVRFNTIDAFYRSELLYGFAFIMALVSVAFRGKWLYRAALALVLLALVPHTYGILARMAIMGRPPVTNLYATFIFVSWTCAVIGLAVEYFQRNRLGLITASTMGLALLMTSARFAAEGDTMGVMVAVLDSNFWLATHVVTISIGYAGCCAAGLLGHIYLLQALRRDPDDPALVETDRAVFGAQAFGLIFSFLGTMLGGIWADQSWGRFWGWDPKENGALVIVLWSAILFHARLGRMIKARGFAAGSVLGVIAVLLAWLGVNLLGVGLHSYGFTSGIARGLAIACSVEVLFVLATVPFARGVSKARQAL